MDGIGELDNRDRRIPSCSFWSDEECVGCYRTERCVSILWPLEEGCKRSKKKPGWFIFISETQGVPRTHVEVLSAWYQADEPVNRLYPAKAVNASLVEKSARGEWIIAACLHEDRSLHLSSDTFSNLRRYSSYGRETVRDGSIECCSERPHLRHSGSA